LMLQPAVDVVQLMPPPAGNGSLIVTPRASPGPWFWTTIVNVAVPPGLMVAPSGVFEIVNDGGVQVIEPGSDTCGLFTADATATFGIAAQWAALVAADTTMVTDVPEVRSPTLQLRTCGLPPLTLQPEVPVDQVTPPPTGSVSVTVTARAVPGPVLLTTMVNVAVAPGAIVAPSGVFEIVKAGGGTQVMEPGSDTCGAFVATAVAVFGIDVHEPPLVSAETTTVADAPAVRSPRLQLRTCEPGLPLMLQPDVLVCQFTPFPDGSVSLTVTLVAVPVPVLLTTIVNVAVAPAEIVAPSGVFEIVSVGPRIWTWSDPVPNPTLPVVLPVNVA